jgi:hypothetical protein
MENKGERERERERNGAPETNVLTSGFPEANAKSGLDYSVFITQKYCFSILHSP